MSGLLAVEVFQHQWCTVCYV